MNLRALYVCLLALPLAAGCVLLGACHDTPTATTASPAAVQINHPEPAALPTAARDAGPTADAHDAGPEAGAESAAGDSDNVAWTDPANIAGLAENCRFAPEGTVRPPDAPRDGWEGTALTCVYGLYGQSCVVDPCFEQNKDACMPRCQRGCEGCAQTCTAGCQSCKNKCTKGDQACALACATTCASCRQECVMAKDRCATGRCATERKSCEVATMARYRASGCEAGCGKFQECLEKCPDGLMSKCGEKCKSANLAKCAGDFRIACMLSGGLHYGMSAAPFE